MASIWITAAAEGIVDEAAVRRLAADRNLHVHAVHTPNGKHRLDRRLRGYNEAAAFSPWLVLRDLDHDAECPAALVRDKIPDRSPNLLLRVPVRSAYMIEFIREHWDPTAAARRSESLRRCLGALDALRNRP